MRKFFTKTGFFLQKTIDFFYPSFRHFVSPQVFHYAVCGGVNLVFEWVLYFMVFHFVLNKQMLHLGFVTLSSHIAAFAIVFPITVLSGFLLQKYVTFSASELRGKVQLFRYFLVVVMNLLINYWGLKLCVDLIGIFPTPSKILVSTLTILLSYICQNKFTFKTAKRKTDC